MYNIVMAADDGYVQHLGVCMTSLFENNKGRDIALHVLSGDISADNKSLIKGLAGKYGQTVSFIDVAPDRFEAFPVRDYYSRVTYYRIILAELMDPAVRKLLYLDCDTVVCGSLDELFSTEMNGCTIAAVMDSPWQLQFSEEHLGIPQSEGYFNAGVMLIDMDRYRESSVFQRSIETLGSGRRLEFQDQDIFNLIFRNDWVRLDEKWNVLNGFLKRCYQDGSRRALGIMNGIGNRKIIHYSSSRKPWHVRCGNPLASEYYKYLRLTPWASAVAMYPVNLAYRAAIRLSGRLGIREYEYIRGI